MTRRRNLNMLAGLTHLEAGLVVGFLAAITLAIIALAAVVFGVVMLIKWVTS